MRSAISYSLKAKTSRVSHVIEIQTDMEKVSYPSEEDEQGSAGQKLRKSRSFVKDQGQRRRKRERSPKQASYDKSRYDEITSDSVLKRVEESKHYVLTQDICMKSKNDLQKTRFPLIFHESRSFLKRKQGKGHNLQTEAKESLPCLDIKANSNEKNLERSQGFTTFPSLMPKKGLIVIAPPSSPVSANISLSPMTSASFSEASPMIPRKKPSRSNEDNPPRRLTPFPGIWGKDRFFITSVGSSARNGKEKHILVEEEPE